MLENTDYKETPKEPKSLDYLKEKCHKAAKV